MVHVNEPGATNRLIPEMLVRTLLPGSEEISYVDTKRGPVGDDCYATAPGPLEAPVFLFLPKQEVHAG